MAGMEALGFGFNIVPAAADSTWLNCQYASGVTFICTGANAETFTVTQATSAAGAGSKNLATVTHVFTNANSNGATPWVEAATPNESAPSAVVTTTTAAPVAAFFVNPSSMDDGFTYIKVTSSSTGTVIALTHGLVTSRKPSNLPALGV